MKTSVPIAALSLLSIVSSGCTTYHVYRQAETVPKAVEASEPTPVAATASKESEAPAAQAAVVQAPKEEAAPSPVPATIPIPTEFQWEIAYHESAHAIATAGILGAEKVLGIMVRSEIGGGYRGDAGYVVSMFIPSHENAATLRGRMAVFFAGRAMDIIVNGVPMASARSDIAQANTVAWDLVMTSGVLAEETGSFSALGGPEQASSELRARVAKELADADATAKAFVRSNEGLIRALAERVMAQEPKGGSRTLPPGQFQALLQEKPIVFPKVFPPPVSVRTMRRSGRIDEEMTIRRPAQKD